MKIIKRLLIANRGEIACRIIRTCQQLNIETVAVFSEIDHKAIHVQLADNAYCLGTANLRDSYLNIEKIIEIAQKAKVDAIHPGYGFLSENSDFSERCTNAGIIFIGPRADAIRAMAVKDQAKQIMAKAGVPIIPGQADLKTIEDIHAACQVIGLPVILKAANGGGGKGMRIVHTFDTLDEAVRQAKAEAFNAFGNDQLFIEKYLTNARHIEIQIFRDAHGNCVHLFERDCSLQRRHQKIIEEAPALSIDQSIKEKMYQAAIQAANAIDYTGAGTIEFLVSEEQAFYFMEMNTRLQVEHPITEMITGIDLVKWQIQVAQGELLPLTQASIKKNGHAIEARIYAEDPNQQFVPQTGVIEHLFYTAHPNTRLDNGVQVGDQINIYFDPLLCKLIAWGENREKAKHVLLSCLKNFQIVGVKNNVNFLQAILSSLMFEQGVHIQSLEQHIDEFKPTATDISTQTLGLAALAMLLYRQQQSTDTISPWGKADAFKVNLPAQEILQFSYQNQDLSVQITHHPSYTEEKLHIDVCLIDALPNTPESINNLHGYLNSNYLYFFHDHAWQKIPYFINHNNLYLLIKGYLHHFKIILYKSQTSQSITDNSNTIVSPMPGLITKIWKKAGDKIFQGEKLFAVEAMKMEHTVTATKSGIIKAIYYQLGEQVIEGSKLIEYQVEL